MACYFRHVIDQRSQQHPDIIGREGAIVWPSAIDQMAVIPLPVGREDFRQSYGFDAVMAKAAGVGIRKRPVDMEANVTSTPSVGEANIEQMGGEGELGNDAGIVEKIRPVGWPVGAK
jgi:hypothetical protein